MQLQQQLADGVPLGPGLPESSLADGGVAGEGGDGGGVAAAAGGAGDGCGFAAMRQEPVITVEQHMEAAAEVGHPEDTWGPRRHHGRGNQQQQQDISPGFAAAIDQAPNSEQQQQQDISPGVAAAVDQAATSNQQQQQQDISPGVAAAVDQAPNSEQQ